MTAAMTRDEIFKLPGIDLHRHLDGACRPEFVLELGKELGVELPTDKLDEFTKLYQIVEPKEMPFDQLFQRFGWTIAVMRKQYGLYRMAREQVWDLARENIFYSELRFAPGYHSRHHAPWYLPSAYEEKVFPVMSLDNVVLAVLNGLALGMKETGVVVNLTLCIPRESLRMWGRKSVSDIVELALRFQNQGVVSIDLACNESVWPPDPYAEYFRATIGSKIRRNPHAGEMGDNPNWTLDLDGVINKDLTRLQNIATCIDRLAADGLGHAIPIYQSKYLMELVKAKNIRIERTPLSPVPGCSLADGHLDELLKNNIPVTIASDDPVLMRASLTDNMMAALDYHNFGEKEFWQLTANGLNTAFFRDEAQKKLVQQRFVEQGLSPSLLAK